jgi:undecaprenyl-diphosphatase
MKIDASMLPRMKHYAAALAGLLLFTLLAVLQAAGTLQAFDESVLLLLRGVHPDQPPGASWLLPLLHILTWFGDFPALLFVAAGAIAALLLSRRRHEAVSLAYSAIIGVVLMLMLKAVFARPRPTVILALVDVSSLSFPSGHALMSVVVYVPLAAILMRIFFRAKAVLPAAFFAFLIVIGFSRLYLGVHYLTDVLAGWALGATVVSMCWHSTVGPDRVGLPPPDDLSGVTADGMRKE